MRLGDGAPEGGDRADNGRGRGSRAGGGDGRRGLGGLASCGFADSPSSARGTGHQGPLSSRIDNVLIICWLRRPAARRHGSGRPLEPLLTVLRDPPIIPPLRESPSHLGACLCSAGPRLTDTISYRPHFIPTPLLTDTTSQRHPFSLTPFLADLSTPGAVAARLAIRLFPSCPFLFLRPWECPCRARELGYDDLYGESATCWH